MIALSMKKILERLNDYLAVMTQSAVGSCVNRSHYEITMAHLLEQVWKENHGDIRGILDHFKISSDAFGNALQEDLQALKTGNTGKPVFSPNFMNALELAWSECSINLEQDLLRTGGIIMALRRNQGLCGAALQSIIKPVNPEELAERFDTIVAGSREQKAPAVAAGGPGSKKGAKAPKGGTNLDRFTINFVEMAKTGKIDPIFARDEEIHQIIDILSRRRKNNPILIGEAGTGKTAVVEGLALNIAKGLVPDSLKNVELRSLDMGLLTAGAGVKGEFENRLKGVIKEVKESDVPIILFIDEAHTMIGAGGEKGTNDAANLLKPELARGELKCLAATTFMEFRRYFEKDPAIARRFQSVVIKEPGPGEAAIMLRGLRTKYEKFHGVRITIDGVQAACELSNRYIAGRQLPDKAVDLLDTSAARVKMGLETEPTQLQLLRQSILNLQIEIEALEKDHSAGILKDETRLTETRAKLADEQVRAEDVEAKWQKELGIVQEIIQLQEQISLANAEKPETDADVLQLKQQIEEKWSLLEDLQGEIPMVHAHVSPSVVARIISEWTGIPAGNMVSDEAATLLQLEDLINERVKGQSWGIAEIADSLRSARTGLKSEEAPLGVFLLTGPSGVGKTETALAISDLLFGGAESVTTINMSEYQDSMSVTQLKGVSAGFVGYGEGGVLTEAVRKRPYTVVVLDEVEKAHKDVLNMFYQVFDKGILRDGEGRSVNFRNTVIIMTSNLGADTIMRLAFSGKALDYEDFKKAVLPELTAHFQPALLARCKALPFMPLGSDVIQDITILKLGKVQKRLMEKHQLNLKVDSSAILRIVADCTVVQSGARNIDTIIEQQILPTISQRILENMAEDKVDNELIIKASNNGDYVYDYGDGREIVVASLTAAPEAPEEPEKAEAEESSQPEVSGGKQPQL